MAPYYERTKPRKRELQPAPGDLLVVQNFLNSADLRSGTEVWETPARLAGWGSGQS